MVSHRHRHSKLYHIEQPYFLTWRLHGSLPAGFSLNGDTEQSAHHFDAVDRLLDEAATGPIHLKHADVATAVIESLEYTAHHLRWWDLFAFAVMPNHVHILASPHVPLDHLTARLKGYTAKRANEILGLGGKPLWHHDEYQRAVRNTEEFDRLYGFIEVNPVRAGLASRAPEYSWSSAWPEARRVPKMLDILPKAMAAAAVAGTR